MKRRQIAAVVRAGVGMVLALGSHVGAQPVEEVAERVRQPGAATQPATQGVATQPAATQPGARTQPAEVTALVRAVRGRVYHAPLGTSPLEKEAWERVQVGDRYGRGTLIRTSWRSMVELLIEPDTVIRIERISLASIDELLEARRKIGLGYGALRGTVRETGLRTDLVIDTPVATLSKQGTEEFGIEVERGGQFWEITGPLSGRVLAEAHSSGHVQPLHRRQRVNPTVLGDLPIRTMIADTRFQMFDQWLLSGGERNVALFQSSGAGFISPSPEMVPGLLPRISQRPPPGMVGGVRGGGAGAVTGGALLPRLLITREPLGDFGTGPVVGPVQALRRFMGFGRR